MTRIARLNEGDVVRQSRRDSLEQPAWTASKQCKRVQTGCSVQDFSFFTVAEGAAAACLRLDFASLARSAL